MGLDGCNSGSNPVRLPEACKEFPTGKRRWDL